MGRKTRVTPNVVTIGRKARNTSFVSTSGQKESKGPARGMLVLASKEIAKRELFLCGSNFAVAEARLHPALESSNLAAMPTKSKLNQQVRAETAPRRNRPYPKRTTPQGEQAEAVNSGKVMFSGIPGTRTSR